jgi:hypothetical protein
VRKVILIILSRNQTTNPKTVALEKKFKGEIEKEEKLRREKSDLIEKIKLWGGT